MEGSDEKNPVEISTRTNGSMQANVSTTSMSALSNSSTNSSALSEMRARIKECASKCEEPGRNLLKNEFSGSNSLTENSDTLSDYDRSFEKLQDMQERLNFSTASSISDLMHLLSSFNTSHEDALIFIFQQLKDELNTKIQMMDESCLSVFLKESIAFLSFKELRIIPLTALRRMTRIPPAYLRLLVEKNMINEFSWPTRRQAWENNHDLFIKSIEGLCATFVHNEALRSESFKQLHEKIGPSEVLFRTFANYCVSGYLKDRSNQWGRLLTNMVIHLNESGQQIKSLTKLHELASMIDRCRRQGKIDVVALKSIRETVKGLILAQATYEEKMHKSELDKYFANHPQSTHKPSDPFSASTSFVERKVLMNAWRFLSEKDTLKLFALPVTEAIAPKYFDFIKNPMDLSTIKKKIEKEKYNTLTDFHVDVELMFDNCKVYNTPLSELGKYAEKLLKTWREKYLSLAKENHKGVKVEEIGRQSKFAASTDVVVGDELVESKEKTPAKLTSLIREEGDRKTEVGGEKKASQSRNQEQPKEKDNKELVAKLRSLLNDAYEFLLNRDHSKIFVEKVTDRIAPEYSKYVKTPMCLNMMKSKLKSFAYDSLQAFDKDAQLLFDNCILYNGEGSYFGVYAIEMKRDWETKYNSLAKLLPSNASTESKSKVTPNAAPVALIAALSDSPKQAKQKFEKPRSIAQLIGPILWEEWQYITFLDCLNVFMTEVDLVGYRDYIKEPMDLGTMKEKLLSGNYRSLEGFHQDLGLMFENCITFNGKDDPFGQYTILLRKWWQASKDYFMKKVSLIETDPHGLIRQTANWDAKQLKSLKVWNSEERKSLDTLIAMETPDAKRGANMAMLQAVLKICIDFLMSVDSQQFFYQVPDDFIAPNYSKTIDKPMSIIVCQGKVMKNIYKSLDNLHDDVLLIVKNCFTYNGTDSDYSKSALTLAAKWYLFYLAVKAKIPFLSTRKDSIVIQGELESDSIDTSTTAAGVKRKFDAQNAAAASSVGKKAKSSDDAASTKLASPVSHSSSSSEPPLAAEYRETAEELLNVSKDGRYSPVILNSIREEQVSLIHPEDSEKIHLPSLLSFSELHEVWHKQSQQILQNLFTYLIRYLSRLDESKFFLSPMQQQVQNSKVLSNLMDFTTMKKKTDRNGYRTLSSFHEDVVLMIRNCFLQFLHEEKNPSKRLPAATVDTRLAAKTAQKLHYAWNIIRQNLEAVFDNDPTKAVESIDGEYAKQTVNTKETTARVVDSADIRTVPHPMEQEPKKDLVNLPKNEEHSCPVDAADGRLHEPADGNLNLPAKSDAESINKESKSEETKSEETKSAPPRSSTPIPTESELLKSSLEGRKQLMLATSAQALEAESSNVAAILTELPAVLTTTAFTWTILMLTEPQLQYFFARFLAIMLLKQLREKIHSHQAHEGTVLMILGQDKLYRYLCQLCQLMLQKELNLCSAEDVLLRCYLPSILLYVANSSFTGATTPTDREYIDNLMVKFPLSAETALDAFSLKTFLEKFLHHLRVVKSKSAEPQPTNQK